MNMASRLRLPLAFLRRDLLQTTSYRFAFALQLNGILLRLAMFYFIAQMISRSAGSLTQATDGLGAMEGLSHGYFPFVLIGLAFYGYLAAAMGSFSGAIRQGQVQGTLEAMLSTRTSLNSILLCSSLGRFFFTSFQVVIYLVLGSLVFGVDLGTVNPFSSAVVLALAVLAFSGFGILSAAFVLAFKRGDPVGFAVGTSASLVGGVYFPIAVLPNWLQDVSSWLPITHALRAVRRTILEGAGLEAIGHELVALVLFASLLLPLGLVAFELAVRRAKVEGTLCQY